MQFKLGPSLLIFFGSYLPLAIILLVQDYDFEALSLLPCAPFLRDTACVVPLGHPWFSIPIFLACLGGFLFTLLALEVARPNGRIDIQTAHYIPAELMSYTLPYVVSFMSIGYQEAGKFLGLTIFLMWMFWITHKSGQLILNPILIAFGWRLYEVTYVFPTETRPGGARTGRALVKGLLDGGQQRPHVTVQDVLVLGGLNNAGGGKLDHSK